MSPTLECGGESKNHCMHFLNMVWTDLIYLVRDSPVTFDKGIRSFFLQYSDATYVQSTARTSKVESIISAVDLFVKIY